MTRLIELPALMKFHNSCEPFERPSRILPSCTSIMSVNKMKSNYAGRVPSN